MLNKENDLTIDEIRESEGLSRRVSLYLDDVVRRIERGGVCITLAQSNLDVD